MIERVSKTDDCRRLNASQISIMNNKKKTVIMHIKWTKSGCRSCACSGHTAIQTEKGPTSHPKINDQLRAAVSANNNLHTVCAYGRVKISCRGRRCRMQCGPIRWRWRARHTSNHTHRKGTRSAHSNASHSVTMCWSDVHNTDSSHRVYWRCLPPHNRQLSIRARSSAHTQSYQLPVAIYTQSSKKEFGSIERGG